MQEHQMEVFLSWSGKRSKAVAEALRYWLPCVLQNVKPWFSRDDIEAGAQWGEELNAKLGDSKMGILCVTPSNTEAPWLLFEAGAIAKQVVDKSRVVPYLTGMISTDVPPGPLTRFQAKTADPEDSKGTKELVTMLNAHLGERGVEEKQLDEIFDVWWPKLAEKLEQISAEEETQTDPRPPREVIEEILTTVRRLDLSANSGSSNFQRRRDEAIVDLLRPIVRNQIGITIKELEISLSEPLAPEIRLNLWEGVLERLPARALGKACALPSKALFDELLEEIEPPF